MKIKTSANSKFLRRSPLLSGVAALLFFAHTADAVVCPVTIHRPEPVVGSWCWTGWLDFFMPRYGTETKDWEPDMGWPGQSCSEYLQFSRTMNAIYILNYGDSPAGGKRTDDFSGSILRWGGNYTMKYIDDLIPRCQRKATALATANGFSTVELWEGFFYSTDPPDRAAALIHEARHNDGMCKHNGNDGDKRCPGKNDSCDESWNDGCWLSNNAKGANRWQVDWLRAYLKEAHAGVINIAYRHRAKTLANAVIDNQFDIDPCLHLTNAGDTVNVCHGVSSRW